MKKKNNSNILLREFGLVNEIHKIIGCGRVVCSVCQKMFH